MNHLTWKKHLKWNWTLWEYEYKGGKIVQGKEKWCKSIKQYNLSKMIELNATSKRIKQIYKQ
jgi:hypothetical protein